MIKNAFFQNGIHLRHKSNDLNTPSIITEHCKQTTEKWDFPSIHILKRLHDSVGFPGIRKNSITHLIQYSPKVLVLVQIDNVAHRLLFCI